MHQSPKIIAMRVASARERRGMSRRGLARQSNTSPAFVDKIENATYPNLFRGPCLFGVQRIADALGLKVTDLAPTEARPDVMAFLRCHPGHTNPDTPLEVFSEFLEFCDIYRKPESGLTFLKRPGKKSFMTQRVKLTDPGLINAEFKSWSQARRRKVYARQMAAWERSKLSELDFFDEDLGSLRERVRTEFVLAACRARDFDGEQVLVIMCEPM